MYRLILYDLTYEIGLTLYEKCVEKCAFYAFKIQDSRLLFHQRNVGFASPKGTLCGLLTGC